MKTATLTFALLLSTAFMVAQEPPEKSIWLTPGKLTRAGLHFKPGISSLSEQGAYQGRMPAEVLTLEWNSLPGISENAVRAEQVRDVPVKSNFVVVKREPSKTEGVGFGTSPILTSGLLVIVAATIQDEILSVTLIGDPRAFFTEDMAHQKPRIDSVKPKVTFDIVVPDQPDVAKLIFLMPVIDKEYEAALTKMAEFNLPERKHP